MVNTLDEWNALGVGFVSATEIFDSTTPQGRLLMHVTSAFAEFERSLIAERTRAGIAAARRRGARIGRPPARLDDHGAPRSEGPRPVGPGDRRDDGVRELDGATADWATGARWVTATSSQCMSYSARGERRTDAIAERQSMR
jgi:hypothetical protein